MMNCVFQRRSLMGENEIKNMSREDKIKFLKRGQA